MKPAKPLTPQETWDALERMADADLIEHILSLGDDELDEELRGAGFDPEEIGELGVEAARNAPARIAEEERLEADRAASHARVEVRRLVRAKLGTEELSQRIQAARRHPSLPTQAAIVFRNRKQGEPGREELASMLAELEELIERHGGKLDE
jgi:hypothetical protein